MDDFTTALTVEDDGPSDLLPGVSDSIPSPAGTFAPLAEYYGYDNPTEYEAEKLKYVWDYFEEESKGPGETLAALRDMERSLSRPEVGQTRLDKLYSYIRLVRAAEDTNAEMRAYLR